MIKFQNYTLLKTSLLCIVETKTLLRSQYNYSVSYMKYNLFSIFQISHEKAIVTEHVLQLPLNISCKECYAYNMICYASICYVSYASIVLKLLFVHVKITFLLNKIVLGSSSDIGIYSDIRGDVKIPLLKLVTFCRKTYAKCMLVEVCRSDTPSPQVRLKGHLGDNSQLLLYYTW